MTDQRQSIVGVLALKDNGCLDLDLEMFGRYCAADRRGVVMLDNPTVMNG